MINSEDKQLEIQILTLQCVSSHIIGLDIYIELSIYCILHQVLLDMVPLETVRAEQRDADGPFINNKTDIDGNNA